MLGTEQHITKNVICFVTTMIKRSELQKFGKNKMFILLCTQIGDLGEKLEGIAKKILQLTFYNQAGHAVITVSRNFLYIFLLKLCTIFIGNWHYGFMDSCITLCSTSLS